jgi:hypothetical protein
MTASSLPSAINFQDVPSVNVNFGLVLIGYKEEESIIMMTEE